MPTVSFYAHATAAVSGGDKEHRLHASDENTEPRGSHAASLALLSISCGSVFVSLVVDPSASLQVFLIAGRSKQL